MAETRHQSPGAVASAAQSLLRGGCHHLAGAVSKGLRWAVECSTSAAKHAACGLLAQLRLEAGDLEGAKQLAAAARCMGAPRDEAPDCYVLGRVALARGTREGRLRLCS